MNIVEIWKPSSVKASPKAMEIYSVIDKHVQIKTVHSWNWDYNTIVKRIRADNWQSSQKHSEPLDNHCLRHVNSWSNPNFRGQS